MPRKHKKLGGGLFDSLGQTFSSLTNSISQNVQNAYNKTKQGLTGNQNSYFSQPNTSLSPPYLPPSQSSYTSPPQNYGSNFGGTKKRPRKMKRGGYRSNNYLPDIVSNAAPYSGVTAKPHNLVGGYKKRTRKSGKKSRKRHHKTKRH